MSFNPLESELFGRGLEQTTRRHFLRGCTGGLGATWLASQLASEASGGRTPIGDHSANATRYTAKARRVIFLHMIGGPSQLELFDYKPILAKYDGKECPKEYLEGQRFAFIQGTPQMLGPQYPFEQHGECGAWVSDRLPNLAKQVDKLCFIKTLQTDQFNHGPAQLMVHTGQARTGYPSIGSWVTWGLGSENADLPGFMVFLSGGVPRNGKALWSGGFLPSVYQGVQCRSKGDPILNISNPRSIGRGVRREMLDSLAKLNRKSYEDFGDPETLTRISQYEMAYRMQMAAPKAADLSSEPQHVSGHVRHREGQETRSARTAFWHVASPRPGSATSSSTTWGRHGDPCRAGQNDCPRAIGARARALQRDHQLNP